MRFAGEMFSPGEDTGAYDVASSYEDRLRERQDAKVLYNFIRSGGLGDPNSPQNQETLKQLYDQISGQHLRGV